MSFNMVKLRCINVHIQYIAMCSFYFYLYLQEDEVQKLMTEMEKLKCDETKPLNALPSTPKPLNGVPCTQKPLNNVPSKPKPMNSVPSTPKPLNTVPSTPNKFLNSILSTPNPLNDTLSTPKIMLNVSY